MGYVKNFFNDKLFELFAAKLSHVWRELISELDFSLQLSPNPEKHTNDFSKRTNSVIVFPGLDAKTCLI